MKLCSSAFYRTMATSASRARAESGNSSNCRKKYIIEQPDVPLSCSDANPINCYEGGGGGGTNLKPLCCCWKRKIHSLLIFFFFSASGCCRSLYKSNTITTVRVNCVTSCSDMQVRKMHGLTKLMTAVTTEQCFKF